MGVRVVSNGTVLASTVEVADSPLARARGLMFRRSIPDDFAMVFTFDRVRQRSVHMCFVPFPLTVIWAVDGQVARADRLSAWVGVARAKADLLVELPADRLESVEIDDAIRIVDGS